MRKWFRYIFLKYFAISPPGSNGDCLYVEDGEWKSVKLLTPEDIDRILL